jgi:hypothetical protein
MRYAALAILTAVVIYSSIVTIDMHTLIKHQEPNILSQGRGYNVK